MKKFFEKIKLNKAQYIFTQLTKEKKCIYCHKKYPDGIIRKTPQKFKDYDAYTWFTTEYLVHLQTTHGYTPDIMTNFIKQLKTNN